MSQAGASLVESDNQHSFMRSISDGELSALTPTQRGFVVSMRNVDPAITGDALKEYIAEMFPPAHLFGKEIADMPCVWMELRSYLDGHGARLAQHSSRRIMLTLANGLYHEAEDRTAAMEMANEIIASGRRNRQGSHAPQNEQSTSTQQATRQGDSWSDDRVAHNVAMRLKDSDKKFTGNLGECWMEFVDEYQQIARDYKLSQTQKYQYLHNILAKDAQRFYLDRVENYATNFQQAVDMINQEYNSPVRQARVKNYLNSLRISDFVNGGMEVSAALAKVYRLVLQLSRQVPTSHRGDAHRIEFLRRAVIGYPWSNEPLSRVATHKLSFQQIYGELEAALQLEKESKIATLRDKIGRSEQQTRDDIVGVNFAGQGRYSRRREQGSWNRRMNPLSISGCFNCDDRSHMLKDCPKPRNVARAAARRLEYLRKKSQVMQFMSFWLLSANNWMSIVSLNLMLTMMLEISKFFKDLSVWI